VSEIPDNELKILIAVSGGRCAFPTCGKLVITDSPHGAEPVFSGQACHIVARSRQGPRGKSEMSDEERNHHSNLILLCPEHHTLIDRRTTVYSVRVLQAMKLTHEAKHRKLDSPAPLVQKTKELLHSTCMAVTQMPGQIFSAACPFGPGEEGEVKKRRNFEHYRGHSPFFLADGRLFSFCDLRDSSNPFTDVLNGQAKSMSVDKLLCDQEGQNRVVRLLNMALRQHIGPKQIFYDKDHRRFHFLQVNEGKPRAETYRSVTGRIACRNVVWQPVRKSTGEPRNYWYHLAAGISFQRVGTQSWVLTLRPERHLTTDGKTPYESENVGRRVTSLKARMFNDVYLEEVHFWRYFLSDGKPHLHMFFGRQHLFVSTELLSFEVEWPAIERDARAFSNVQFEDDLFTFSERRSAGEDEFDEDFEEQSE
jgi:hypothetical protein